MLVCHFSHHLLADAPPSPDPQHSLLPQNSQVLLNNAINRCSSLSFFFILLFLFFLLVGIILHHHTTISFLHMNMLILISSSSWCCSTCCSLSLAWYEPPCYFSRGHHSSSSLILVTLLIKKLQYFFVLAYLSSSFSHYSVSDPPASASSTDGLITLSLQPSNMTMTMMLLPPGHPAQIHPIYWIQLQLAGRLALAAASQSCNSNSNSHQQEAAGTTTLLNKLLFNSCFLAQLLHYCSNLLPYSPLLKLILAVVLNLLSILRNLGPVLLSTCCYELCCSSSSMPSSSSLISGFLFFSNLTWS